MRSSQKGAMVPTGAVVLGADLLVAAVALVTVVARRAVRLTVMAVDIMPKY
ncbi:MAG: hypothetical protein IPJ65_00555 [Archangiaceae bacterium]|nr:hypothetical protein [Archangiaceae bacterium]